MKQKKHLKEQRSGHNHKTRIDEYNSKVWKLDEEDVCQDASRPHDSDPSVYSASGRWGYLARRAYHGNKVRVWRNTEQYCRLGRLHHHLRGSFPQTHYIRQGKLSLVRNHHHLLAWSVIRICNILCYLIRKLQLIHNVISLYTFEINHHKELKKACLNNAQSKFPYYYFLFKKKRVSLLGK